MSSSYEMCFESFGVVLRVRTNVAELQERLAATLPVVPRSDLDAPPSATFALEANPAASSRLSRDGNVLAAGLPLEHLVDALQRELRTTVAEQAPNHIFIHSGAVGYRGRAILLPGESFAGKTSLVAALVRGGATYLSDEYAPLDEQGLVHPFHTAVGLRGESSAQQDQDPRGLGWKVGRKPLRVGLVAIASYRPESHWAPRRLSSGEAVLAMLANTIPAQSRPTEALQVLTRALDGAVVLQSERGEADLLGPQLLRELRAV